MSKEERKKTGEELQEFLAFRKRGYWLKNKKGKASYDRAQFNDFEEEDEDEDDEEFLDLTY